MNDLLELSIKYVSIKNNSVLLVFTFINGMASVFEANLGKKIEIVVITTNLRSTKSSYFSNNNLLILVL